MINSPLPPLSVINLDSKRGRVSFADIYLNAPDRLTFHVFAIIIIIINFISKRKK